MAMPLIDALEKYLDQKNYPLHGPGHKCGLGLESHLAALAKRGGEADAVLANGLDDLHNPTGVICEGQSLAAKLYAADATFWCVNGATEAIHAMLLAAVRPGDKVLVPRNAHMCVHSGLVLSGAKPVYVAPEYNEEFGIYTQVQPEQVEQALKNDREIRAVLITSPNYYGVAADLEVLSQICHRRGVLLLVDEAQGAHLGFSNLLPASAMKSGADAAAQSTHKMVGALSQAAMLHVSARYLELQRVADAVDLLTTGSPNWLLLASLDAARAQLAGHGKLMLEKALEQAKQLQGILEWAGIRVLKPQDVGGFRLDETKVLANLDSVGISSSDFVRRLRAEKITVELVDERNVLFLVTFADYQPEFQKMLERLQAVLSALPRYAGRIQAEKYTGKLLHELGAMTSVMSPRDVFYAETEQVGICDSVDRIAAESVAFFPPGIPVLLPGERITQEMIEHMLREKDFGLTVKGPADAELLTLRVVKE